MNRLHALRAAVGSMAGAGARAYSAERALAGARVQLGSLEARQVRALPPTGLREAEFSVFSQFGEDGIIQFLVQRVPIENEVFVEFGVEDYAESNTRFLLVHDNWRGFIMDGGESMHTFLEETGLRWRHWIDARTAFVDRDNVDGLISAAGIEGDIGLLSVDIDGNDYWVIERVESVSPRILVAEYNSTWGPDAAVTTPYDPKFVRSEKHPSYLYWGASIAALTEVAGRKGYALVGGNLAGNNVFFVRRDVLGDIPEVSPAEAWAPSRFRESRDHSGELTYVSDHRDRLALIADMPLHDVEAGREVSVRERFGLG